MRIGIDARLINETGVGRYITNLIVWLAKLDDKNEYIVYLPQSAYAQFVLPNNRWQKKCINIHWHSVSEQIILPFIYLKDRLSVLHIPYFTVPILYPGRIICTIHDLTILHVRLQMPLPLAVIIERVVVVFAQKCIVAICGVEHGCETNIFHIG